MKIFITKLTRFTVVLFAVVYYFLSVQISQAAFFTDSGLMNSTHVLHTATLLPDGNVLVASGSSWFFNAQVTNICRLYDPATGIWLETGGLNIARWQHTASLIVLPRRFSHCQNQRCDKARWEVLVAGGQDITGVPIASAELYESNFQKLGI